MVTSFQNFLNSREQKDATFPAVRSNNRSFARVNPLTPEDREWQNSEEYKAVQNRVDAGDFSYAYQGNRARVQAFNNARKDFEQKKKIEAEAKNIRSVRIYNLQGEEYDPQKESPETFLERDKNNYITQNDLQSFTSSNAEAEALYYQQLVDSNNFRARKEYGGAVIDRPVNLPTGDFNAQINVYKTKILESLRPSVTPGAGTRTGAQVTASREIKGGRRFAKTVGGFANPASTTFLPNMIASSALYQLGKTTTGNEDVANVMGQAGQFVGFGLAGKATTAFAKKEVFDLANLGWKTLKGSKNLLQKTFGSKKSRSAEQLQNAIQDAAASPPSTQLTREELIQSGYTTPEQRLAYNRSQINPDANQRSYQTTFLNEAEDGSIEFTTGSKSIKVTDVDSFVDASSDVLGLQDEVRETLRPVLRNLFVGIGRTMRVTADEAARMSVREVYELPSGTKNKVAEFAADSNNVGIDLIQNLGGVIGYVKYGKAPAQQADGYVSVLHEVGHAILPAVLRIAKETTPANKKSFAKVLQERIIDRGTFTEAQKNIIYQTDLDELVDAVHGSYRNRSSFNKLSELEQGGEDFGLQLNEAFTELFVKYMSDVASTQRRAYSFEVSGFLDEATAFTQKALTTLLEENPQLSGAAFDAPRYANFTTFRLLLDAVLTGDTSKLSDPAINKTFREISLYSDQDQTPMEVNNMVDFILGRRGQNLDEYVEDAVLHGEAVTDIEMPFREFHVTNVFRNIALAKLGDDPVYAPHLELIRTGKGGDLVSNFLDDSNFQMLLDLKIATETVLFDPKNKTANLWELSPQMQDQIVLVNPLDANDVAASAFKDSRGRPTVVFHGGAQWTVFDHQDTNTFGGIWGPGLYATDSPTSANYLSNYLEKRAQALEEFELSGAIGLTKEYEQFSAIGRIRAFSIKVPESKVFNAAAVGDSDAVATRYFNTLFSDKGLSDLHRAHPDQVPDDVRVGNIEDLFSRDILKDIRSALPVQLSRAMFEFMDFDPKLLNFATEAARRLKDNPDEFFNLYLNEKEGIKVFGKDFYEKFPIGQTAQYGWNSPAFWSEALQLASIRATKNVLDYYSYSRSLDNVELTFSQKEFIKKVDEDYAKFEGSDDKYNGELNFSIPAGFYTLPYVWDATRAINLNGDIARSTSYLSDPAGGLNNTQRVLTELAFSHKTGDLLQGFVDSIHPDSIDKRFLDRFNGIYDEAQVEVLDTIGGMNIEGIPHKVPILVGNNATINRNIAYVKMTDDVPSGAGDYLPVEQRRRGTAFARKGEVPDDSIPADKVDVQKSSYGNEVGSALERFNQPRIEFSKNVRDKKLAATEQKTTGLSKQEADATKLNVQAKQDQGLNASTGKTDNANIIPGGTNTSFAFGSYTPLAGDVLREVLLSPTDGVLRTSTSITEEGQKRIYEAVVPRIKELFDSEDYKQALTIKKDAADRAAAQANVIIKTAEEYRRTGRYTDLQATRVSEAAKRKSEQVKQAEEDARNLFQTIDMHPLEVQALIDHGEKVLAEKALRGEVGRKAPTGKRQLGAKIGKESGVAELGGFSQQDYRAAVKKLLGLDIESNAKVIQDALDSGDTKIANIDIAESFGTRKLSYAEVLTPRETVIIGEALGITVKRQSEVMSLRRSLWRLFANVFNLSRITMLTGDMSAIMNQGVLLGFGSFTKVKGWTNLAESIVGTLSAGNYNKQMLAIYSDPDYAAMEKAGVFIGDINGPLAKREEAFLANLFGSSNEVGVIVKKYPALKPFVTVGAPIAKIAGYPIRASQRFHTLYLNKLRYSAVKDFNRKLIDSGLPDSTRNQMTKRYADFVNKSTGRGNLGKLENLQTELNDILLAPRWLASRVQTPIAIMGSVGTDVAEYYGKKGIKTASGQRVYDFQVSKQIANDLLRSFAVFSTIAGILTVGGYKLHTDWRRSDFGKLEKGRINIDITGGLGPIFRFMSRSAKGIVDGTAVSTMGVTYSADVGQMFESFLRSKFSPMSNQAYTTVTNRNFYGEAPASAYRFVPGMLDYRNYVPLFIQTVIDSAQQDLSPTSQVGVGIAAFGGTNIGVYPDKEDYSMETYGIPYKELYPYEQTYIGETFRANNEFASNQFETFKSQVADQLYSDVQAILDSDEYENASEKNGRIYELKVRAEAEIRGARKSFYGEYEGTNQERTQLEETLDEYFQVVTDIYGDPTKSNERRDEEIKDYMDSLSGRERAFVEANRSLLPLPEGVFNLQKRKISPALMKVLKKDGKLPDLLENEYYSVPAQYARSLEAQRMFSGEKNRAEQLPAMEERIENIRMAGAQVE